MLCCFINLAERTDRRQRLEQSFFEHASASWQLKRIEAVDTALVRNRGVQGSLRDAEKACFLSHSFALGIHRNLSEPMLVVEDDAQFGPDSCAAIEAAIVRAERLGTWDIVFTDIITPLPSTMGELAEVKKNWQGFGVPELIDLKGLCFAGSTAYVVHPQAIGRLFGMLDSIGELNTPYDLFLRHRINDGRLQAWAAFPYPTTVQPSVEESSIQLESDARANLIWDSFRRMMWLHAYAEEPASDAGEIPRHCERSAKRHLSGVIQAATEIAFGSQAPV